MTEIITRAGSKYRLFWTICNGHLMATAVKSYPRSKPDWEAEPVLAVTHHQLGCLIQAEKNGVTLVLRWVGRKVEIRGHYELGLEWPVMLVDPTVVRVGMHLWNRHGMRSRRIVAIHEPKPQPDFVGCPCCV